MPSERSSHFSSTREQPRMPKARRSQKPTPKLPRQREQKHVPQPTLAGRERILSQLDDAVGACEDLLAEHGEGCMCEACCITSNMVGSLRVFRMLLAIS